MKWLRRALLTVVALALVAWGGINLALATSLGPKWLNSSPDDVQFSYSRAAMWIPGIVNVEDFTMSVQDPGIQWQVTVKTGRATLHPFALAQLAIHVSDIDADEVRFRLRSRVQKDEVSPAQLAAYPPIEAWPSALREGKPVFAERLPFIDLERIHATNVNEIWVNEYHYQGNVTVNGGFELQPLTHLTLDPTDIHVQPGVVSFGGKVPLKIEESDVSVSTGRIVFETASLESLEKLNVVAKLEADVLGARFINVYLRDVPGVHINDGAGSLKLDVAIKKGVVSPGSTFQLVTDQLVVRVPYVDVQGKGEITGQVDGERPAIRVAMKSVSLEQRSTKEKVLQAGQFTLAALLSTRDLSEPQSIDLALDLGHAKAPDLTFLNTYIPEGSGVRIFSGSGVIGGNVNFSSKRNHLEGKIDIDASRLAIKNRNAVMTGRATIRGVVPDMNVKTGAMNISGSHFRLDNVEVATPTRYDRGFWLSLAAPKAALSAKGEWDSSLELAMSNLQPALTVMTSAFQLPEVLAAVVSVPDVKVSTDVNVTTGQIELSQLTLVSGGALSAEGNVVLREAGTKEDKHLEPWGLALVTYTPLKVGLDLQGQLVKPILGDPEKWYRATLVR